MMCAKLQEAALSSCFCCCEGASASSLLLDLPPDGTRYAAAHGVEPVLLRGYDAGEPEYTDAQPMMSYVITCRGSQNRIRVKGCMQ